MAFERRCPFKKGDRIVQVRHAYKRFVGRHGTVVSVREWMDWNEISDRSYIPSATIGVRFDGKKTGDQFDWRADEDECEIVPVSALKVDWIAVIGGANG